MNQDINFDRCSSMIDPQPKESIIRGGEGGGAGVIHPKRSTLEKQTWYLFNTFIIRYIITHQ